MNHNAYALSFGSPDRLTIDDDNRHQYYSTMQAEVCDEDLLDIVYNRRRAQALMARHEHRRMVIGLTLAMLSLVGGLVWYLA